MMRRRDFLPTALALPGIAAAQPSADALTKPRALKRGDTVGIIAPSTAVFDPDTLARAERNLASLGLQAKWGKHLSQRADYPASVTQRIEDLHAMFRDPQVAGVFALRGGYGAMHLLDRIDYGLIRANPKVFLGFSDITALHLAIQKKSGLATFHGPVTLSAFTEYSRGYFERALFRTEPIGPIANPPGDPLRTVRPGVARGRIVAGNLTLITNTMGTPYEIETRGRILCIEDVGEEAYRIDRMLTQLRLAGKLQGAAGIVWGHCSECGPSDYKPSFASIFTLGEVVDNLLGSAGVPVLSGLMMGHTSDQVTLPEGALATLDAGGQKLVIEESGVVA